MGEMVTHTSIEVPGDSRLPNFTDAISSHSPRSCFVVEELRTRRKGDQ